jgi:glycosyltransferase involved in cell wall biosynthesis
MVINEAASLGKALIATDACGAAHHLIVPNVNGFRVPADDHRALAEAMARYCREPGLARRHGEESRRRFLEFTPARNVARLRQCLDSLRETRDREEKLPATFLSRLQPRTMADGRGAPKISIVMPTFNHRPFIERSILSVLNQDYPNLEFIIVDGGSTDGTLDIIKKYACHFAYWVSERDAGQSDALNKGFRRATGDIYGWLNSDDLYMPGVLKQVARVFAENPLKGIVHGDWLAIDADDDIISHEYSFDFSLNQFKYEGFHIMAQAMFWRSDVHSRFGGFEAGLYNTMDYQMILEFGINEGVSAFLRMPMTLGCFRRHPDQKTLGFTDRVRNEHQLMAGRYGYLDKYEMAGKAKRILYRFRRAYWYLKRGGVPYFLDKLVVGQKNG